MRILNTPNEPYIRPLLFNETEDTQALRIESELTEVSTTHAVKIGNKWIFETLPSYEAQGGTPLSEVEIRGLLKSWCASENIWMPHRTGLIDLVCEQFTARRNNGSYTEFWV